MSFWCAETLSKKLPGLIEPYDSNSIDCAAYTLHIGYEVYVPGSKNQESRPAYETEIDRWRMFCYSA